MTRSDLGPMPDAEAEDPQLHPGGPDAVLDRDEHPLPADPVAEANPATEDAPAETQETEDTSTRATREDADAGDGNDPEEAPA